MRIGNRIFPYPILNSQRNFSAYGESSFDLRFESKRDRNSLVLKGLHYELSNPRIMEMIRGGRVSVYCIIECSSTVYRKSFPITEMPSDVMINIRDLKDWVTVSAYGVAQHPIRDFHDEDFILDYKGYTFDIEPNDIMLADDGFRFYVDYEESEDNKVSSIICVVRDDKITDETIKVLSDTRKIYIYMPPLQYERYDSLKGIEYFRNMFFSLLLIPALSSELNKIRHQLLTTEQDIEDVEFERHWFRSVSKQFEKAFNKTMSIDVFNDYDMLTISQKLINMPIVKAIDEIYNLDRGGAEDDD